MDLQTYAKKGVASFFQTVVGLINLLIGLAILFSFVPYSYQKHGSDKNLLIISCIGLFFVLAGLSVARMGLGGVKKVVILPEGLKVTTGLRREEKLFLWSEIKCYKVHRILTSSLMFVLIPRAYIEIWTTQGKKMKLLWLTEIESLIRTIEEKKR